MTAPANTTFERLDPDRILNAVETHTALFLDGTLAPYNSYVNRVFGVTDEDENRYIAKFYRPGRWSREAILEEHRFLADCAEAEIPIVPPMAGKSGSTLGESEGFFFAVFPRVRARSFDIVCDEDWIRVGRVIGRLHAAGKARKAVSRLRLTPEATTAKYISDILSHRLVHPDCLDDFSRVCDGALSAIEPLFDALDAGSLQRIHGDCHRGNILCPAESEIILLDFDDMMTGPAVQDLWLLLPGHLEESMKEMNLMLEGYEEFSAFDRRTLALVEPLRFMRHIYFLNWCAIQREDEGFAERNPGWGSRSFWITETEDLSAQLDWLGRSSVY